MKTTTILIFTIILFITNGLYAQYGALDEKFGIDGMIFPKFGFLESENHFLVVQSDGKIVTSETVSEHGANAQFYLTRYTNEGLIDTSYGNNGVVISSFLESTARVYRIEIQTDDKIIMSVNVSEWGNCLIRYNSDGTLDNSFGVNGKIIKGSKFINSYVLQADGKIIVSETFNEDTGLGSTNRLVRYNSDGTLDAEFGINGNLATDFSGKIVLQPDGKILFLRDGSTDFFITRYFNNGLLDHSFGANGTAVIDVDVNDGIVTATTQHDGSILFIGCSWHTIDAYSYFIHYSLIQLLSNGGLDTNFGNLGITPLQIRTQELAIQPDRKIIAVGGTLPIPDGPNQIALLRFFANGGSDNTFGENGMVTTSLGQSIRGGASSVKLASDGKIIVGGVFCEAYFSCHPHSFISKYNSGIVLPNTEFNTSKYGFTIYPNPVNQIVNLDFNLDNPENISIDLYDCNGRKLANLLEKKAFATGYFSQKLEIPESLSKGIYFLNISKGTTISSIKIVK
jgi:uncharacterized delta-60 repeat protein